MNNVLDLIVNAQKEVGQLDIQNKAFIVALLMSARRNVEIQLFDGSAEGFKVAVDIMNKVGAIEDYIKRRRGKSKAELVTQNLVATERLRITRDIGGWLEKHLAGNENKRYAGSSDGTSDDELTDEQLYWLEDLEIGKKQSFYWRAAARGTDEEFERWVEKFLDTAMKTEDELYLSKYLSHILPKSSAPFEDNLNPHEEYRKYLVEFGKRVSGGNVSKGEFVKEKDEWIKTQKCGETIMRQRGELY